MSQIPFIVTLGIWLVAERLLVVRDAVHHVGRTRSEDRGSKFMLFVTFGGALVAAYELTRVSALGLPGPTARLVVGLVIAWAGIALRFWSVRTLGQFFTTTVRVRTDQTVVTNGPYRVVRHPSYAGLIVIFLGLGIAAANAGSLAALLLLPLIGLVNRIRVEERALRGGLGEAYVDYCNGRTRLIPKLW